MLIVAADTETALIRQGLLAPPMVCTSYDTGSGPGLLLWNESERFWYEALGDAACGNIRIVGHNIAFDMAVVMAQFPNLTSLIFEAYAAGGIEDTLLREKLRNLALGELAWETTVTGTRARVKYSLDAVAGRRLGLKLDKGADGWRTRYMELHDVPVRDWPERASSYAKVDATTTLEVYRHQEAEARESFQHLPDLYKDSPNQARQAFGLHLMSCRGMMTDPARIQVLTERLQLDKDKYFDMLEEAGVTGKSGSISQKPFKEIVEEHFAAEAEAERQKEVPAYERNVATYDAALAEWRSHGGSFEEFTLHPPVPPQAIDKTPRTPSGATQISAEVLKQIPNNPICDAKIKHAKTTKLLGTYANKLWLGVDHPIQPRINSLLETGRTSMAGWTGLPFGTKTFSPQTAPQQGGIRECFVPRPGYVFANADYAVAELRSLGQVMKNLFGLDGSPLAQAFQADPLLDPHAMTAARMMGIPFADALALKKQGKLKARKDAKAGNFGFPGGMGVPRFVATEKKKYWETDGQQGGLYDQERATSIKQAVVESFGLRKYFDYISDMTKFDSAVFQTFVSGRYRGGCGYCDGANGFFQAMTADGAKEACFAVAWACYAKPESPLYGSYPVLFVHDELLLEVPIAAAPEAALELARIMEEAMEVFTPDIKAIAEPLLCDRFSKNAEPVFDGNERLQVWSP